MKIGIQQLQIGKTLTSEKKAMDAISSIKNAGFEYIELNGFMIRKNPFIVKILTGMNGMPIKHSDLLDWKKILKEKNLPVSSIHENLRTLETNINRVIQEAKEFQTNYIVLTGNYNFDYASERNIDDFCLRLNEIGKNLWKENIQFLYHNHNAEFMHVNPSELCFDRIIGKTDSDFVSFEFDSYWPSVSGVDALYYMKKLGPRIRIHHICDNGYSKSRKAITPIIGMKQVELGKGCINLSEMIQLDKKNHTDFLILEQHKNHIHNNPIESASLSIDYLKKALKKQ